VEFRNLEEQPKVIDEVYKPNRARDQSGEPDNFLKAQGGDVTTILSF